MADPIEHTATSAVATAGWSAGKWALAGAAAAVIVPLAVGLSAIAGTAALVIAGHTGWAIAAGIGGALATMVTTAAATTVGFTGSMIGGGLLGIFKGSREVSAEMGAARNRIEQRAHTSEHKQQADVNTAAIAGMQQGYAMGFQEGQQALVNQLQQAAMASGQKPEAAKPEENKYTKAVIAERAKTQAEQKQI